MSGGVKSGEVAPYIDIDFVFVADARCINPESLDTQNSEICIRSIASLIDVLPHRLIMLRPFAICSPMCASFLLPNISMRKMFKKVSHWRCL